MNAWLCVDTVWSNRQIQKMLLQAAAKLRRAYRLKQTAELPEQLKELASNGDGSMCKTQGTTDSRGFQSMFSMNHPFFKGTQF